VISVTGHSLGAALATLYVMENAKTSNVANQMIYTFASPLVGDQRFVSAFAALGLTSWRIANRPDVIPYPAPAIIGFSHVDALHQVDSAGLVTADRILPAGDGDLSQPAGRFSVSQPSARWA